MLDDHDREAGALEPVRAYDRHQVEQYLALLLEEADHLRARLEAAHSRRTRAEQGTTTGLPSAVHLAMQELGAEEQAAAEMVADLHTRSVQEARQLLAEAEREALLLRDALAGALEELDVTRQPSMVG